MFGGADVTYSLDCVDCSRDWSFQHKTFTLRSSEIEANALYARWNAACDALRTSAQRIVDAHFARLGVMNKKAELAELVRLGLSAGTYRSYLDARRSRSAGQVAGAYGDCSGLIGIAGAEAPAIRELVRDRDQLRRAWEEAGKRVVRRGLPQQ